MYVERRNHKVNADKIKGMVSGGEEGSICEVLVDGKQLEHVFKLSVYGVLGESGTDDAKCW